MWESSIELQQVLDVAEMKRHSYISEACATVAHAAICFNYPASAAVRFWAVRRRLISPSESQ